MKGLCPFGNRPSTLQLLLNSEPRHAIKSQKPACLPPVANPILNRVTSYNRPEISVAYAELANSRAAISVPVRVNPSVS